MAGCRYWYFNKIITEPELASSLPYWAKNIEMFVIEHTSIWPSFLLGFKINKHKCNFHYITYDEILKSMDFIETQKSRYLVNEALVFPQIKKLIQHLASSV